MSRLLPTIKAFLDTGASLSGTAMELNGIGIKTAQAMKNVLVRGR